VSDSIDNFYPSPCSSKWEEMLACLQQLTPSELAQLTAHLRSCDDCCAVLEEYRQQDQALLRLYTPQRQPELPSHFLRSREHHFRPKSVLDSIVVWGRPLGIALSFGVLTFVVSQTASHLLGATLPTIVLALAANLLLGGGGWLTKNMAVKWMQHKARTSTEGNHRFPLLLESVEGVKTSYGVLAQSQGANHSLDQHSVSKRDFLLPRASRAARGAGPLGKLGRRKMLVLTLLFSLLAILGSLLSSLLLASHSHPSNGIGVQTLADGESIGISDGRFAFDIGRPNGSLKIQAASQLRAGDGRAAAILWQQAVQQEPNDAEALIYQEDQRVLASGRPYITIVVATILTGNNRSFGLSNLQGAYVAQKEFNDGDKLPGGVQVRLLIANSGSASESDATQIAEQITQAAGADQTIVGVMGWPLSQSTLNAIDMLTRAHLPLVSESATADELTGRSPYFFRVVSPNQGPAEVLARYAEQKLQAQHIAVFVDSANSYSSSLASDFTQQFHGNVVVTEHYTVGEQGQGQLPALLQDALSHHPDLIFFSGYAQDASVLLTNLPTSGASAKVQVLGGDGLYELGDYSHSAFPNLGRLHFTGYAYPDEWSIAGLQAQQPAFFAEYSSIYGGHHPPGDYGFTRASNETILSYDATLALLTGSRIALSTAQNPKQLTSDAVRLGLTKITGAQSLQGASGQIAFGFDGNPINKAVVMLYFDTRGQIHEEGPPFGCFLLGQCQ
jgi:ABC-type branched-subunit amino acid transport system substrate-binding protein